MAKTAKPKKREISQHSRAARRAASPSLNLDSSLKSTTSTTTPKRSSPAPATLAPQTLTQPAGIHKKQKKGTNNMTRAQRLRHQRGLEKAAEVLDKRQVKVVKSLGKEKVVKERSRMWEDVNGGGGKKGKAGKGAFDVLDSDEEGGEKREKKNWGDEEMGEDEGVGAGEGERESVVEKGALGVEEDELL